jgi:uncharacterized protein
MWLRDSAAQVRPYLLAAENDEEIADLIEGVVRRQLSYILHDPYANAFNESANHNGHQDDITDMTPLIWERKYEIDSLCYPIQLSYLLWKSTGRVSHFNQTFVQALRKIIHTWTVEQNHEGDSPYQFVRENVMQSDTLNRNGKGSLVAKTGMTWSGFRPSDDACLYGYLIPANMFATVILEYAAEICKTVLNEEELMYQCEQLASEIKQGIEKYAIHQHPYYGDIYGYETDGMGNHNLMDDANVPSLLSLPYLGWCQFDDPTYLNTRQFILSRANPYFYEGKVAKGIGSPHTPDHYIWHIALAIQGMTTNDESELTSIVEMMKATDGGTGYMHEGFSSDQPAEYTREWFSWANSMFSELILYQCGYAVKGSPLFHRLQKDLSNKREKINRG